MEEKRAMFYILSAVMTIGKLRSFQFLPTQHWPHTICFCSLCKGLQLPIFLISFVLLHPRLAAPTLLFQPCAFKASFCEVHSAVSAWVTKSTQPFQDELPRDKAKEPLAHISSNPSTSPPQPGHSYPPLQQAGAGSRPGGSTSNTCADHCLAWGWAPRSPGGRSPAGCYLQLRKLSILVLQHSRRAVPATVVEIMRGAWCGLDVSHLSSLKRKPRSNFQVTESEIPYSWKGPLEVI